MSKGLPTRARSAGASAYEGAVSVVLTGIAVILPGVITVYVLDAAMGILVSVLDPVIRALVYVGAIEQIQRSGLVDFLRAVGLYSNISSFLSQLIALVLLVAIIVALGVLGRNRYGDRFIEYFDTVFMAIPGIGTIYESFRRMSEAMLSSDMQNFRSVKLVEFPREGTFVIGFETARPPATIPDAAGAEEMTTMFLPLAPNPVMGGFLTHIPEDRILDVDMTVEEGVRNIITSGLGTQESVERAEVHQDLQDLAVAEEDLLGPEALSGDEDERGGGDERGREDGR